MSRVAPGKSDSTNVPVDSRGTIYGLRPFDIIFFAAAFIFLYTQLFQLPFTPYYFEGDHLIPVSNAIRLYQGEVMYRDFFHLTPPGAELWYASFFSFFGIRIWILNFTILVLSMSLTAFAWHFARQCVKGLAVYLPPTVFLVIGFRLFFIDGSYRLFSVIFVFSALAVLLRKRDGLHLTIAGVLCGLASFFVQPRGVMALAGILIFLMWERFRRETENNLLRSFACLTVPFVVTLAATHAYFLWSAGFDNYYFSLVTFLRKHYPNDPLSNGTVFMADIPSLQQYFSIYSPAGAISRFVRVSAPTLFFYALVPWVYLLYFFYRWRVKSYVESDGLDRKLVLLSIVGITLSAGVSAPSVFRLAHVAIPGIVALTWMIARSRHARPAFAVLLVLLTLVGAAYIVQRQTVEKWYLDMPGGEAAFLSEHYFARYKWMSENTRPGDTFYEGHHPSYYFPFHLKNPTPMYLLRDSDYSPAFQVESVVRSLEDSRPEFIAWPRKWSKPASERLPGDNLEPLWEFVKSNYEPYVVFEKPLDYTPYSEGDIEIWKVKIR